MCGCCYVFCLLFINSPFLLCSLFIIHQLPVFIVCFVYYSSVPRLFVFIVCFVYYSSTPPHRQPHAALGGVISVPGG